MKKFKAGEALVFQPSWSSKKFKGAEVYYNHPLKYEDVVHFLAYHSPAIGHCIVTTYEGQVITMMHPEDFRLATDEEV